MTGPVLTCPKCGNTDSIGSSLPVDFDVYWDPENKRWIADFEIMHDMLSDIAAEVAERANGADRPTEYVCGECDHDWKES